MLRYVELCSQGSETWKYEHRQESANMYRSSISTNIFSYVHFIQTISHTNMVNSVVVNLTIVFTTKCQWIYKYMWIEKYMFSLIMCGSICREATLDNLSHSSICNLIVCVHSAAQCYCCYFFYGHIHTRTYTKTQIHKHTPPFVT